MSCDSNEGFFPRGGEFTLTVFIAKWQKGRRNITFRQALQQGGNVRKGEKSCPVVFWKQTTIQDEETGGKKEIRLLRVYHVFNVA